MTWGNTGANTPWSMTFGAATGSANQFSITDTTGSTNTLPLVNINTVGTSTALPLQVTTQGTANGVQVDLAGNLKPIGTGLITGTQVVNSQMGTTYTFVTTDRAKLVTLTNASSIAVTLPQAGLLFPSAWYVDVQNRGPGNVTITPTTSTIDGVASIILQSSQGLRITSDGTNYFTQRGAGSGSGSPVYTTVTFTTTPVFTVSGTGPNSFKITLTGNVTSSTLTNAASGQQLEFDICQDATGGRSFVFPTNVLGAPAIASGVNACTRETFLYDGTNANFNGFGSGTPAYTVVSFSTTPTFTASGNGPNAFKITLTGNVTSSTLAGAVSGQELELDVCQDGTGGRTFTFPTNVIGSPVASGANVCTREMFTFDGTNANASSAALAADNSWLSPQRFSKGPLYDVTASPYNASGSGQTTTATTTASSTTVTLGAAIDFKNGQGIYIDFVGANGYQFCSSIVSGAGTTTLVLAASPSVTQSGAFTTHDDGVAIQAANDAAEANGGGTVFFPYTAVAGRYRHQCAPLHKHGTVSVKWLGDGTGGKSDNAKLFTDRSYGPGLVVMPGGILASSYMGANLMTGGTNSFNAGIGSAYFDLRQCRIASTAPMGCGEVDGLATMTVELDFNLATLTQDVALICSSGIRDSADGYRSAFCLAVKSTGALQGVLTTSNNALTTITGATGQILANTTYHGALIYNGATFRITLNGVSQATASMTGTVQQGPFETVNLGGGDNGTFPFAGPRNYNAPNGRLDGVRISNSARYTSFPFTAPTAKWPVPPDSNTMIQMNFTSQTDVFTNAETGIANAKLQYLPILFNCPGGTGGQGENTLENLTFNYGDGIVSLQGAGTGGYSHIRLQSNHNGFQIGSGCSYNFTLDDITLESDGRYGLALYSGIGRVSHISSQGSAVVQQYYAPGNAHYDNLFITPFPGNVITVLWTEKGQSLASGGGDYIDIRNFESDIESGAASLQALMLIDNFSHVRLDSGILECSVANSTCAPLIVQSTGGVDIHSLTFDPGTAVTPIHCINPGNANTGNNITAISIFSSMATRSATRAWTDCPATVPVYVHDGMIAMGDTIPSRYLDVQVGTDFGTAPLMLDFPNGPSPGTVFPGLAVKLSGAPSAAVLTAATDTRGVLGCVAGQAGTTGQARISTFGYAYCVVDNATVAGDYLTTSSTQIGALHDAGATAPTTSQVIGRILNTAALIPTPGSMALACPSTGGTVAAGTYRAQTTVVNAAEGETLPSAEATVTCSGATSSLTIQDSHAAAAGSVGFSVYITGTNGGTATETKQVITNSSCAKGIAIALKDYSVCPAGIFDAFGNSKDSDTYILTTTPTTNGVAVPSANTAGPLIRAYLFPEGAAGGGSGTPGGANTQIQWNNNGAFAGSANVTYTSGTGAVNVSQLANSNDFSRWKRFTDTAPTGFVHRVRNAADTTDLYTLDVLGNTVANTGTFIDATVAGGIGLSQGPTSTTAKCPALGPNCILHQAPTAVTPFMVTWPGVAAAGVLQGTISGSGATLTNTLASVIPTSILEFPMGTCTSSTAATSAWDTAPSGTTGTAACITDGSNTHSKPALQFVNASTPEWRYTMLLPPNLTGNADMTLVWQTATVSGTFTINLDVICVDPNNNADTVAFSVGNFFAPAAQTASSTANNLNLLTVAGQAWPASCTSSRLAHFRLRRTDTGTAVTASVVDLQLVLRRTF